MISEFIMYEQKEQLSNLINQENILIINDRNALDLILSLIVCNDASRMYY